MINRSSVRTWILAYEQAWQKPGTDQISELFTSDATYQMSPFQEPHRGLDAIRRLWEAERGPNEQFTMEFDIVAVDERVAVIRLEVKYGRPNPQHFRDLWILDFASDGRCRAFEEWPFTADHPAPHHVPEANSQ